MITLNIDGKRYRVTNDPTIEQWQRLMKWNFEDYEHWTSIVAEVTGAPEVQIREMDYEQLELAVVMIAHSVTERRPIELPDFGQLTFGQFIDCEYWLAVGLDKSLPKMLESLEIETTHAQEALYVIEKYAAWRTSIYKQYTALFAYDDPDLDELAEQVEQKPLQIAKAWYNILIDLAGENVLNINKVTELGVKQCLNFMASRKEKQLAEIAAAKQRQRQYDLQRSSR